MSIEYFDQTSLKHFLRNGKAVQVDPIKPTLKPSGAKRLKLKYDGPLSNFAFKFNLRRCTTARSTSTRCVSGRGLHSFTFQLNLCRV